MIKEAEAVAEGGCIIDAGVNVKMLSLAAFFVGLWRFEGQVGTF